jgi:hypothetical protein
MEMVYRTELQDVTDFLTEALEELALDPARGLRKNFRRSPTKLWCVRGNGWQSPIARWVRRMLLDANGTLAWLLVNAVRVSADRQALEWQEKKCWHRIELPQPLKRFEAEFQAGEHPWLEA